jgi:hydrogenase/urease accessory protein HupE
MKHLLTSLLLSLVLAASLAAHPVAQGNFEITVDPAGVTIHARVANEQVFVAEAFGNEQASDADGMWTRHGGYLLQRLKVEADGRALAGSVLKVHPPEDRTGEGRTSYDLRFALAEPGAQPKEIVISQNVLNEIEFAPGNPWEATYLTRIVHPSGRSDEGLLFTSRAPLQIPVEWTAVAGSGHAASSQTRLFSAYFQHGVMHILTGYDHLLFVAALVLAALSIGDLIRVVTAFTLAHTITLALSVLNVVRLPSSIVEPIIAGSIVVVALQNIISPKRSRGWTRLALAFAFGLFHGLGFAGGLMETMEGLPGATLFLAIVAFSIGVETGHAAVVLPLFGALRVGDAWKRMQPGQFALMTQRLGSAAICCAGMVYFVASLRG